MKKSVFAIVTLAILGSLCLISARSQEKNVRVAAVGFSGEASRAQSTALSSALEQTGRTSLVDTSLIAYASAGIGYNGSINMGKSEARGLGAAIGCDFFVIGKVDVSLRSEKLNEPHWEALIAVMLVEARSGALAHFDMILERAAAENAALEAATRVLERRASAYIEKAIEFTGSRSAKPPGNQVIEEIPEEGSRQAQGFNPPEFLNRIKPQYTEQADRAGISATVEAWAVFQANGEVSEVEIVRWAGFGLDETAVTAIRQLKFKAALRDGRPVSVRGLIRYNFKTTTEPITGIDKST